MKATIQLNNNKSIKLELFPDQAPISVANFVELAKSGFYNGLIFHRVIPSFMVQGGGFESGMKPKEAKSIKGEFRANGVANDIKHSLGTISMARTNMPNSASSQFFIFVTDTPHLDGSYAAFGRTLDDESNKVAIEMSTVRTTTKGYFADIPVQDIIIEAITIED